MQTAPLAMKNYFTLSIKHSSVEQLPSIGYRGTLIYTCLDSDSDGFPETLSIYLI
jgi:hypothetical protein